MRRPLRSMRPMISPTRPRWTPSGLTRTRVRSGLGTSEQPSGRPDHAGSAVAVARRLRDRLAVVLHLVDPQLVGPVRRIRDDEGCGHRRLAVACAHRLVVLLEPEAAGPAVVVPV